MHISDTYRRHAAECLRLAESATECGERLYLLHLARAWRNLADRADRNSAIDG